MQNNQLIKFDRRAANLAAIMLLVRLGKNPDHLHMELCKKSLEEFGLEANSRVIMIIYNAARHWREGGEASTFKHHYINAIQGGAHSENTGLHRLAIA